MSRKKDDPRKPERRAQQRIPAQIKVRLKLPDVDSFLERYATNISRGGIFVQTQRTKPKGTVVQIEFQIADASPVVRGEARVVYTVPYDPENAEKPHGMGVKFTRLDPASQELIDRAIAERLAADGGTMPVGSGATEGTPPAAPEAPPTGPTQSRDAPGDPPGGSGTSIATQQEIDELVARAAGISIPALVRRVIDPPPANLETAEQMLEALSAELPADREPPTRVRSRPPRTAAPPPVEPEPPTWVRSSALPGEPEVGATPLPDAAELAERVDRLLDEAIPDGAFSLDLEGGESAPEPSPPPAAEPVSAPAATPQSPPGWADEVTAGSNPWDQITVVPDGNDPVPGADFTPPTSMSVDVEPGHGDAEAARGSEPTPRIGLEEEAFSMDDAPLIEESESGTAERTAVGGSAYRFEEDPPGVSSPEAVGRKVTATHEPVAIPEAGQAGQDREDEPVGRDSP